MGFPKDKIDLNSSNYKDFLPINIVAYSYAKSGAMGEAGGVYIISKEGQIFHLNYVYGGITSDEVNIVCPPLKEQSQNFQLYKENWKDFNMGMGNYLTVHISIYDKFQEKIQNLNLSMQGLFQKWKSIVLEILAEDN